MKNCLLLIVLIVLSAHASTNAQSPGGVGTTNLKLWNKADLGVTGTSPVTAWADQSGTQTITVTGSPQLVTSTLNYNPGIILDGSSRFTGNTTITNMTHVFAVAYIENSSGASTSGAVIGTNSGTGKYFFHTEGFPRRFTCSDGTNNVEVSGLASNSIQYSVLTEDLGKTSTANDMMRINGAAMANANGDPAPFSAIPALGARGTENLKTTSGLVECIVYNTSLSATNESKVESYLAIKYGLTLSNNYLNAAGTTVYNVSTYSNNIIGIARDDNSTLMQKQSQQRDDATRIYLNSLAATNTGNGGSFSSNGQFVMIGNDGAALVNDGTNTDFPSGYSILSRFNREWKITNTAFTGTFSLDITPASGSFDSGKIRVLIDDDGTFSNATMYNPVIGISGGVITISGISNTMIPANSTKYLAIAVASTPGGVSSESIWLKTDAGITQSGGAVSQWDDVSGNGHSTIQPAAGSQPVLTTDTLNYYPVVTFDGGDDVLEDSTVAVNALMNITTGSNASTTGSLFTVSKIKSFASGGRTMYQWNRNPSATNFYTLSTVDPGTGNIRIGSRSINVGNNTLPSTTPPFIATALETPGANNTAHYYNGGREIKTTNATININTSATNFLRIGTVLNGYVAEIVSYKTKLTDIQRRQVESYLAIKYAVTIDTTTNGNGSSVYGDYVSSSGATIWDASVNYGYHKNVIGIGRDDSSALYQKQSHQLDDSTRIYLSSLAGTNTSNSGTYSNDLQFVMMGNNNAPLRHSYTNTEYPAGLGIYSRLDREWKITNTAFTGTFSVDIKPNTSPITASDLRVLIDDDGNFTNATLLNPSISYSSGVISITGISNAEIPVNSTKYLTVASMNSTTPLPVELINFTAKAVNNKYVQLDWQTASEINSASFIIERSADGTQWQQVTIVNAAGNSSSLLSYSYNDNNPIDGISYYRIKQTDIDGKYKTSPVRNVTIDFLHNNKLKLYPNPATGYITVEGLENNSSGISIYDATGRNVSRQTKIINQANRKWMIDVAKLPAGIYLVGDGSYTAKLYKQ